MHLLGCRTTYAALAAPLTAIASATSTVSALGPSISTIAALLACIDLRGCDQRGLCWSVH